MYISLTIDSTADEGNNWTFQLTIKLNLKRLIYFSFGFVLASSGKQMSTILKRSNIISQGKWKKRKKKSDNLHEFIKEKK